MPSATFFAASPSTSSTVTEAPARASLPAQALPIPLAAPVTSAPRPVRSRSTVEVPGTMEASPMILLQLEEAASLCPVISQSTDEIHYRLKPPASNDLARGRLAGDLAQYGRRQKPISAGVASVSAPAEAHSRPSARVQTGYVVPVGLEYPGVTVHLQSALGVEQRTAHVDAVERRLQRTAGEFIAAEGVRCQAPGRAVGPLYGRLQGAGGKPEGLCQLFEVFETPDFASLYDLVEAGTERGFVDLLVEDLPRLPAWLGHHGARVLRVADGLAPEALAFTVDEDGAVHDDGPGDERPIGESHGG